MANTTFNPADKTASCVLSNGNLTATANSVGTQSVRSIYNVAAGKYYWECTFANNTNVACGIANGALTLTTSGISGVVNAAYVNAGGTVYVNNATAATGLGAFATGTIACIALDLDNRLIWIRRGAAGLWNASAPANPATGVGGFALTFVGAGTAAYALMSSSNANPNGAITGNFGDSAFTGAVPAGFLSGFPGTVVTAAVQVRALIMA